MDKQPQSRAPLIVAIVLLLLPLLYVGSYLALVTPEGPDSVVIPTNYRLGGNLAAVLFWPLEQIDHRLKPLGWGAPKQHVKS